MYPDIRMLMWTEDSWKLGGAKACAYNSRLNYVVVEHRGQQYMMAEKRVGEFVARVGLGKQESFRPLMVLAGEQLVGMTVLNPLSGEEMPLIDV